LISCAIACRGSAGRTRWTFAILAGTIAVATLLSFLIDEPLLRSAEGQVMHKAILPGFDAPVRLTGRAPIASATARRTRYAGAP
jgi:hypothetical protein